METDPRPKALAKVAVCFGLTLLILGTESAINHRWSRQTGFDDAYMFTRYARNFRHGLGISWNSDGIHTYGLTSLPWFFCLLPLTLFLPSGTALHLSSSVAAEMGLWVMALSVCSFGKSRWLSNPIAASLAVCLPLFGARVFGNNVVSGMDTMLALAANAALTFAVLSWQQSPSTRRAVLIGLIAFCSIAVRLDNGISAMLVPLLASFQVSSRPCFKSLAFMCGLPLILLAIYLLLCQLYFGTALPLSFYAKSAHSYVGFTGRDSQATYLIFFLRSGWMPFVVLLAMGTVEDLRKALVFVAPALLTFAYLLSVRQIMGMQGRFYMPQVPYLVVPALLVMDRCLQRRQQGERAAQYFQIPMIKAAFMAFLVAMVWITERNRVASTRPVAPPSLVYSAKKPLPPLNWADSMNNIVRFLREMMPDNGVIAATEVGYLGEMLPKSDIVDLAGLNDRTIGLEGFSMDYLLSRKPDLIWFPHTDYSGLRSIMYRDPRLYQQYEVIVGAFDYGIAIRKDSPYRPKMEAQLKRDWAKIYPGTSVDDYIARLPT